MEENGLASWEPTRRLRWEKVGKRDLIAWYPYDITNPFIYNLHIDQSDETKLKAADLINGYWYDVPKDYVDIPMKHRHAYRLVPNQDYLKVYSLQIFPGLGL